MAHRRGISLYMVVKGGEMTQSREGTWKEIYLQLIAYCLRVAVSFVHVLRPAPVRSLRQKKFFRGQWGVFRSIRVVLGAIQFPVISSFIFASYILNSHWRVF